MIHNRVDLDQTKLRKLYLIDKKSISEISDILNIGNKCVSNNLKRYKIPIRSKKEAGKLRRKHNFTYDELYELYYEKGFSTYKIADIHNVHPSSIKYQMKILNIPRRKGDSLKSFYIMEKSHSWKKGSYVTSGGYIKIKVTPDDQFIIMADSHRYIFEHRYVMAKHLDRPLARYEIVHHKNNNRSDNRIENLILLPNRKHGKRHNRSPIYCRGCNLKIENNLLKEKIKELENLSL